MIEIKTSGEIFEDVFMEDTLANKNKLWVSKDSLIKELKIIDKKLTDNHLSKFIEELEKKDELRKG